MNKETQALIDEINTLLKEQGGYPIPLSCNVYNVCRVEIEEHFNVERRDNE